MSAPLLVEIGCEEIPAAGIAGAAAELGRRIVGALEQAGLAHGESSAWGGSRRLAVRIAAVEGRQADREDTVLGPPARAAFGPDGSPTAAAVGFARKHGVPPGDLSVVSTEKGEYAALRRSVPGRTVGEILAESLPGAVEGMSFPKAMRWGAGSHRWVRPVHWLVALHGGEVLPAELFDVEAGRQSRGHRFLSPGAVRIPDADGYADALEKAFVLADPAERRRIVAIRLAAAANAAGGSLVEDAPLLEEVADLVEWPGVITGRFEAAFLDLPREILVATLRHHQKAFSVERDGRLLPAFLAVANTDRDPAGHVRRGNEWVVGGRLEDARFFWSEDGKTALQARVDRLAGIVQHAKVGTYREKAERVASLAEALARRLGLPASDASAARRAALLSKADLPTGLVAEFPELQGVVGGLLLRREGEDEKVSAAVYEHYRPRGPDDPPPATELGAVLSVADKIDSVASLLAAGERPTGSRDPFGLRRATAGIFRIAFDRSWSVSLEALGRLSAFATGGSPREEVLAYLEQRLADHLRERGFTIHEVHAALKARAADGAEAPPLPDVLARLDAVRAVRNRSDFRRLVELTKRSWNITRQTGELLERGEGEGRGGAAAGPPAPATRALGEALDRAEPAIRDAAARREYGAALDVLAGLVDPVGTFFDEVLVLDPEDLAGTRLRHELLVRLRTLLTRHFDLRELPGDADRRP